MGDSSCAEAGLKAHWADHDYHSLPVESPFSAYEA